MQTGVGIKNTDFTDFKITENNLKLGVARNVIGCSARCLEHLQCLSFSYNKKTSMCEMWDEDFIHINATDGSTDVGWIYYYILRDLECGITKENCLSHSGFFYTTCFCHRLTSTQLFYQNALDMCASYNSSLAKVNRGFFQLTLENILAPIVDGEVRIQGDRANVTSTWRFNNGDLMKYFNWNTNDNQPDQSPTELSLVIRKSKGYRWHDALIEEAFGAVCQIY
ncbi:Hypothetical predicted protein [Mytilus galloprovincialis]|uniref:C-type lectin domain-containing protein n=1 Tax=Mytilus galloprovincialis TaxID=29158 RepID=A0A8B6DJA1_MYTGA|nr:Hypothetical predicted protein [Mytilus galloprovincialis]